MQHVGKHEGGALAATCLDLNRMLGIPMCHTLPTSLCAGPRLAEPLGDGAHRQAPSATAAGSQVFRQRQRFGLRGQRPAGAAVGASGAAGAVYGRRCALIDAAAELDELDSRVGDGDCGTTLRLAAQAIREVGPEAGISSYL